MKRPSRALPTVAVGFLLLDALLLAYGGVELHRPVLLWVAGACAVLAVVVVLAWQRYRRALADLDAARREMHDAAVSLRDLLQQHRLTSPPTPVPPQRPE
jgi:Zn-dependent protease with chaperone function